MFYIYKDLLVKKYLAINFCFFINAVYSSLTLPLIILFLLNKSITVDQSLFIGVLVFWSGAVFNFLSSVIIHYLGLKNSIVSAYFIKILSTLVLLFEQTFTACMIAVILNGGAGSLFSLASKLYLKNISEDISRSFSVRFTLHNIGASIAPIIIMLLSSIDISFTTVILILLTIALFSTIPSFYLVAIKGKKDPSLAQQPIKFRSNIMLYTCLCSMAFAIFYYILETIVPVELVNLQIKGLLGPLLLFNTLFIIAFQMPLYQLISHKFNDHYALSIGFIICITCNTPLLMGIKTVTTFFISVLGITLLEIFFATARDSIIVKNSNDADSTKLFIASSLMLSVGASLTGFIYSQQAGYLLLVSSVFLLLNLRFGRQLISH